MKVFPEPVLAISLGLALLLGSGCATQSSARADDEARSAEQQKPRKKSRAKRVKRPARPAELTEQAPSTGTVAEADAQQGGISWYHDSLAGRRTANGERYNPRARTCAHKQHKFGTRLRVTITDTGATAECRVNDRGPFVSGRVLDVSRALAEDLDLIDRGVADGQVVRLIDGEGDG